MMKVKNIPSTVRVRKMWNRQIPDVGFLDDRESQKPEVQSGQGKRDPSVAQKSGNRSGKLRGTG